MSKKEYILSVLEKVSGLWEPANNIKELLLQDQLTDTYIDYLYEECVHAVDNALESQNEDQQQAIIARLQNIKISETKQNEADQQDIEKLEDLISNM